MNATNTKHVSEPFLQDVYRRVHASVVVSASKIGKQTFPHTAAMLDHECGLIDVIPGLWLDAADALGAGGKRALANAFRDLLLADNNCHIIIELAEAWRATSEPGDKTSTLMKLGVPVEQVPGRESVILVLLHTAAETRGGCFPISDPDERGRRTVTHEPLASPDTKISGRMVAAQEQDNG